MKTCSSRDVLVSRMPIAFPDSMYTDLAFNLWTEPQANAEGAKKYWPRGNDHDDSNSPPSYLEVMLIDWLC